MLSGLTGYRAKILAACVMVFALWAAVAIAGVNEDLIKAALRGDLVAVKACIANGADVNAKDKDGSTALIWASAIGNKEVVQLLLAKRADVNAKDNQGFTALMQASAAGYRKVVKLLLANGANVNAKDKDGWTVLMFASRKEVKELLIRAGAK